MSRQHLDRFYHLLDALSRKVGGPRRLSDCSGRDGWPERGVYFFFEEGETREDGESPRVVRVGTHALSRSSRTTLWKRLAQHRGTLSGSWAGGGNHRGSIFRHHVGTALLARDEYPEEVLRAWASSRAHRRIRDIEYPLERAVSQHIGRMPFLWLAVLDAPGRDSRRGYLEANAIGLLSNCDRDSIDPPSPKWLGRWAHSPRVRESGLWNVNHVDQGYDPAFLDLLERYVLGLDRATALCQAKSAWTRTRWIGPKTGVARWDLVVGAAGGRPALMPHPVGREAAHRRP